MTLREMVETLRISPRRVEIRDADNWEIMTCGTDSKGIEPYLDMRVSEWFPGAAPERHCDFTVSLKVPKEQTQPKKQLKEWTPIQEGPPKKFGRYLVTITPAAGELWSKVEIAHYSDLMGIAKPGFWTGNVGKNDFEDLTELVTAWAPCPEPYKKEDEE